MRIRTRAFVLIPNLLSLNVMVAQVAPPARSTSLIGTWEAVTRSAGGLGSTISFAPDNSMSFTLGAMVDMKYKRPGQPLHHRSREWSQCVQSFDPARHSGDGQPGQGAARDARRRAFERCRSGDRPLDVPSLHGRARVRGIHAGWGLPPESTDPYAARDLRNNGRFSDDASPGTGRRRPRRTVRRGRRYPGADLERADQSLRQGYASGTADSVIIRAPLGN